MHGRPTGALLDRRYPSPQSHVDVPSQRFCERVHGGYANVMRHTVAPVSRRRDLGAPELSEPGMPARHDPGVDERCEELLEGGRSRREKLRAMIKAVIADTPRRHATADAARLFEDRHLVTGRQFASDDEPGQSGSDYSNSQHVNIPHR